MYFLNVISIDDKDQTIALVVHIASEVLLTFLCLPDMISSQTMQFLRRKSICHCKFCQCCLVHHITLCSTRQFFLPLFFWMAFGLAVTSALNCLVYVIDIIFSFAFQL